MASTYSFIASYTATSTVASYTFTSVPSTYDDLVLLISARTSLAGYKFGRAQIQLNSTTTGYSGVEWYVLNTSDGTVNMTTTTNGNIAVTAAGNTSNDFGVVICNIMNYKQTSYSKQINMYSTMPDNSNIKGNDFVTLRWNNTAAVSSIAVADGDYPLSAGFVSGTSMYLYGIKRT